MRGPTRRRFIGQCASAMLPFAMELPAPAKTGGDPTEDRVGDEYLAAGLGALCHSYRFRWNQGHHGAAVIAAYYLCKENSLTARAGGALARQLDDFMNFRHPHFQIPLAPTETPVSLDPILEALEQSISDLRSGGHNVIYAALALKALRDLPQLASPTAVDGIVRLLRRLVQELPVIPEHPYNRDHPLPPYLQIGDVVNHTIQAFLRPWNHFQDGTLTGTGNVVHWITHADALITLWELGYDELARKGSRAHRQYINHPVSGSKHKNPSAPDPLPDWLGADYWESSHPRTVQRGTWFFGHSFKFPYSLFRTIRRTENMDIQRQCIERAALLPLAFQ